MKPIRQIVEEHKLFITEDMVEAGYQRLLDGPDFIAHAAALERHGGPCPICGVEFARIEVDNAFGKFGYYQPACRCYKVCKNVQLAHGTAPGCGRFLISEKLAGIDYCTACYSQPPGTKAKPMKTHRRSYSGKDAAAGERDD